MSNTVALWLVLIAFIVSIGAGYKYKLNTGIIAMVCSFLIGCFVLRMKATAVVGLWPTSTLFTIIAICFMFSFAGMNGTLEAIANKMLYWSKGSAALVPWVIFFMGVILGSMGAGNAVGAFLCPLAMVLAKKTGQNPLLTALAYTCGNLTGADNPFTGYGGGIMKGCIEAANYNNALSMAVSVWLNGCVKNIIIFVLFYILFRGWKGQNIEVKKPEPLTPTQKKTLIIVLCSVIIVVLSSALASLSPSKFTKLLGDSLVSQSVVMMGGLACVLLKLGDERKAISRIPWNTILMIAGVSMLVSIATKAGATEVIASWVSTSSSKWLIGVIFMACAAFMSFFSGAVSVVTPTLFPLVPAVVASSGLSPTFLFACIYVGANSTALSPFSTAGSLALAGCVDEEQREGLFYKLIPFSLTVGAITIIYGALLGGMSLFK